MVIEDVINVGGGNWDFVWEEKVVFLLLVVFWFVDLFDIRLIEDEVGRCFFIVMIVKFDVCELGSFCFLVKELDEDKNFDVDIFVEVGIWILVCIEGKNFFCWLDGVVILVFILNDVLFFIVDFWSWDLLFVNMFLWKLEDFVEIECEVGFELVVLVIVDVDMCFIGFEFDLVVNLFDDEKSGMVFDMLLVLIIFLVVFWGCDCIEEVWVVIVLDEIVGLVLEVIICWVFRDSGGMDLDFLIFMFCWEVEIWGKNFDLWVFNLFFVLRKLFWDLIFFFFFNVVLKVDVFVLLWEYVFWIIVLV